MKLFIRYVAIVLLVGGWLSAHAVAQPQPGVAAIAERNLVVTNDADYTLTLHDPFSPIGYRLPMLEGQTSVADALAVSNVPPPSVNLKAKAKTLLRVRGIIKRGNTYVANVNGAIVKAGDEIEVTVDGQRVAFIVRTISLKRVELESRE